MVSLLCHKRIIALVLCLILLMAVGSNAVTIVPKVSSFDGVGDFNDWTVSGNVTKDANGINRTECVRIANQGWFSLDLSAESTQSSPYRTLCVAAWVYEPSQNVAQDGESMSILLQTKNSTTGPAVTFSNVEGIRYIGYKVGTDFYPVAPAILNQWAQVIIQADCDNDKFQLTYNGIKYGTPDGFPFSIAVPSMGLINMVQFCNGHVNGTTTFIDNVKVVFNVDPVVPSFYNFNTIGSFSGWWRSGFGGKVTTPVIGTTGEAIEINPQTWIWLDLNNDGLPYTHIIWTMQVYEPSSSIGAGRTTNFLMQSTNLTGVSLTIDDVGGIRTLKSYSAGAWVNICPIIVDRYVELKIETDFGNPTVIGSGNPQVPASQRTVVTYNGVRYDNGGQGYAYQVQLPKIQKLTYSNGGVAGKTYIDDVRVEFSSVPMVPACSDFNPSLVKSYDSWFYESGAFKVDSPIHGSSGQAVVIQKASWLYKNFRMDANDYTNLKMSAWVYESATNTGRSVNILVQEKDVSTGCVLAFDSFSGTRYLGYLSGTIFVPITPAITGQYVTLQLEADAAVGKGKFAVIYDGIRYDNSGNYYEFNTKLYKIDQIMFSNTSYSGTETFYLDDICLDILHPVNCGDLGTPYYPMDYNRDCVVNFKDLAFLASFWLQTQSITNCTDSQNCAYSVIPSSYPKLMYLKADLDQNTHVDFYDLKYFVEQWLSISQF